MLDGIFLHDIGKLYQLDSFDIFAEKLTHHSSDILIPKHLVRPLSFLQQIAIWEAKLQAERRN